MRTLALAALFLCVASTTHAQTHAVHTGDAPMSAERQAEIIDTAVANRHERIAWWRDARFGMFIHWGLYAQPAGTWDGRVYGGAAEWLMHTAQVQPEDWTPLADTFNPADFDADAWAQLAADAGMKYLVITSRHHEGFSLLDAPGSDFDITATPFAASERSLLRELADACRQRGIRIGWYHTILDWTHPDYLPRRAWDDRPADDADYERYVAYLHDCVETLLTDFGPIDMMWFDGEWEGTWTHDHGLALYAHCLDLAPNVIVNNRVDKGRRGMAGMNADGAFVGDYGTPEQEIPARGFGPGVDWESCMTMNGSWGYHASDHNWKSVETLVRNLIDCASKGGNYLLNVGPDGRGNIPEPSVERLLAMGDWLDVHGDSIYGTEATLFTSTPWGRSTTTHHDDGRVTVFLHLFDAANGVVDVPGLRTVPTAVRSLTAPDAAVRLIATGDPDLPVQLSVPAPARAGLVPVIALEFDAAPEVVAYLPVVEPDDAGVLVAAAADCYPTWDGPLAYEEDKDTLGFWTNAEDAPTWRVKVPDDGRYAVALTFACEPGSEGSTFELTIGGNTLRGTVPATNGWEDFATIELLGIGLEAGRHDLTVTPTTKPGLAVMNLRSVTLTPTD